MTRKNVGSMVAGVAAAGFLGTAALHSTGYGAITRLSEGAASELQAIAPALWLAFSFDLIVLGLVIAVIAFRPSPGGRLILVIAALAPISAAMLQLRFLGFVPPTAILFGIGALALIAAGVLPRSFATRLILLAFGVLAAAHSVAVATEPPDLKVGARVRVEATVPARYGDLGRTKKVTGPLIGIDEATLTVKNALTGAVSVFPREDISKLELSVNGSQRGSGALKGLGVGAAIGALAGYVTASEDDFFEPVQAAGIAALLFGTTGALIGAAVAPGERWESLSLGQARVGFEHSRQRGGGAFVNVSF